MGFIRPKASGLITALLAGAAFIPGKVNAQQSKQTEKVYQNDIYSKDKRDSAAGDGIFLKRYVHDLELAPGTKYEFNLYAKEGDIHYDVMGIKQGLKYAISYLEHEKNLTKKDVATIEYFRALLNESPESDSASVSVLKKSLADKVIDANDSLFVDGVPRVKDGRYVVVARSDLVEENGKKYLPRSLPIIIDVKNSAEELYKIATEKTPVFEMAPPEVAAPVQKAAPAETPVKTPVESAPENKYFLGVYGDAVQNGKPALEVRAGFEPHVSRNLRLGLEAAAYFGKPEETSINTENMRESVLIGPNTEKERTDNTNTHTEITNLGSIGPLISYEHGRASFYAEAGALLQRVKKNERGMSVIDITRDNQIIRADTIAGEAKPVSERRAEIEAAVGMGYRISKNFVAEARGGIRAKKGFVGVGGRIRF